MKYLVSILALLFSVSSYAQENLQLQFIDVNTTLISNGDIGKYTITKYSMAEPENSTDTSSVRTDINVSIQSLQFFPKTEGINKINNTLSDQFNQFISSSNKMYRDNLDLIKEFGRGSIGLEYRAKYQINHIDNNLISITLNCYIYSGGAHGISHISNYLFDIKSGEQIKLEDILNSTDPKLIEILKNTLLEDNNLTKDSFFKFDEIVPNQNFAITDKGITFLYNHYEITSYASGTPEAMLSFDEIKPFLKKESPLSHLIKSNKIAIVWTSKDLDVAMEVAFPYAFNSAKREWFDDVVFVIWGPSAKLAAKNKKAQEYLIKMKEAGVKLQACLACADNYGVTQKLRDLGIEVKYMGSPLSGYIKNGYHAITF